MGPLIRFGSQAIRTAGPLATEALLGGTSDRGVMRASELFPAHQVRRLHTGPLFPTDEENNIAFPLPNINEGFGAEKSRFDDVGRSREDLVSPEEGEKAKNNFDEEIKHRKNQYRNEDQGKPRNVFHSSSKQSTRRSRVGSSSSSKSQAKPPPDFKEKIKQFFSSMKKAVKKGGIAVAGYVTVHEAIKAMKEDKELASRASETYFDIDHLKDKYNLELSKLKAAQQEFVKTYQDQPNLKNFLPTIESALGDFGRLKKQESDPHKKAAIAINYEIIQSRYLEVVNLNNELNGIKERLADEQSEIESIIEKRIKVANHLYQSLSKILNYSESSDVSAMKLINEYIQLSNQLSAKLIEFEKSANLHKQKMNDLTQRLTHANEEVERINEKYAPQIEALHREEQRIITVTGTIAAVALAAAGGVAWILNRR